MDPSYTGPLGSAMFFGTIWILSWYVLWYDGFSVSMFVLSYFQKRGFSLHSKSLFCSGKKSRIDKRLDQTRR
jgi:hypothetical protein